MFYYFSWLCGIAVVFLMSSEFGCRFGGVGGSEATSSQYLVALGSPPRGLGHLPDGSESSTPREWKWSCQASEAAAAQAAQRSFSCQSHQVKGQCRFEGWEIGPTHWEMISHWEGQPHGDGKICGHTSIYYYTVWFHFYKVEPVCCYKSLIRLAWRFLDLLCFII